MAPAKPVTQKLTAEAPSRTAEPRRKHSVSSAHSALAPCLRGEKCCPAAKDLQVCSTDHSAPLVHPFIRFLKNTSPYLWNRVLSGKDPWQSGGWNALDLRVPKAAPATLGWVGRVFDAITKSSTGFSHGSWFSCGVARPGSGIRIFFLDVD